MTYVKVSVPKPGNNAGVGGDKKSLITFFDFDDVLTYPARDSKGIVMTDNIVLKEGAYMIQVYASTKSIKINQDPEGEEDARGILQKLEFSHPGSEDAIEEMLANWMNRDIGCVVENCSTSKKRQLGTPCAPLELSPASEDSNEKNHSMLTLTSKNKSAFRVANYQGTLTFAEAFDVDADATSIDLSNGEGRYQLTDGSASAAQITTATNAVNGMAFTLLGSGGDNPSTIEDGDDFLLANGTTWTALAGSEITFKAFKDGAASWKFYELSRS
jgi:hypothetical protein